MDTRQLIIDTAERIFGDHVDKAVRDRAEDGALPTTLWRVLDANGLTAIGALGSESSLDDAYAVLRSAGRCAVPGPLAETLIANRLWSEAGGSAAPGATTVAIVTGGDSAVDVPWAKASGRVLCIRREGDRAWLAMVESARLDVRPGANMAGEARDDFSLRELAPTFITAKRGFDEIEALLALSRAVMMAGCLETVLRFAVTYALARKQFGKPISGFQAIQHQLAVLAGETAAAVRAANGAVEQLDTERFVLDVAAAKSRVGEAAGRGAEIAHQVHGAIGFTHEHELHQFTRRLWAWREEYGNEAVWQTRLGRVVAARGADAAWAFVASF